MGKPLILEELSKRASGKTILAVVKADVDNLGALFSLGLGSQASILKAACLSRSLEVFFGAWLGMHMKDKFPNMYLVYSGGDDLLAIGPWNEAIEFAHSLRQEFRRYTANNSDITLSAGIALFKVKHPIWQVAEEAEEAIKRAKEESAKGYKTPKDQVAMLGEAIKWDDWPLFSQESQRLCAWLQGAEPLVSTSFVYRLLNYARMHSSYAVDGRSDGLKYVPLLTYDIARNYSRRHHAPVQQWAASLVDPKNKVLGFLGAVARYALLRGRGYNA